MSLDDPIDLVPTEKAAAALDSLAVVQVGDVVRVGRGKHLWKVTGFWEVHGEVLASLEPLHGYTSNSARVDRLTVVQRGGGS